MGRLAKLADFFTARRVKVSGMSMSPHLSDGDRAVVSARAYRAAQAQRFDVVLLKAPETEREDIKRIVGLPGELVEIRAGALLVDGSPVDEPHLSEPMPSEWLHAWYTGPDEYVVLGDNRAASTDSRRYGVVHRERIVGPVVRRG